MVRTGPMRTLRRALLLGGLLVVTFASAAMLVSASLALSQRKAVERDSDAFMDEQRIADQIVARTYEQQLDAYRFLQRPDTAYLRAFRGHGEEAYSQIRGYLFHELSTEARLQVEGIKEAHQQFEVAAERAFDLAQRGQPDAARQRLEAMDQRAVVLDNAVGRFLHARAAQSEGLRLQHTILGEWIQLAFLVAAGVLALLVLVLSSATRRHVLTPLDHLANTARRLGEGDTSARVPPQAFEEFHDVAVGFNQMADRIEASREKVVAQNQELREALDHLHATQEDLVQHEKLSAMGQMLAGLAHELNNPLAGILGMAECLREELAESPHAETRRKGVDLAGPLEREALRANALVRSLLSFARKPSGTLEPVGLAAAVSTAVGLRAHAFAQAGKTLHVQVPPELYVVAESQKLQHAIVNVVNNALDAIIAGKGEGLVITATSAPGDVVHLDFDDDGTGIEDIGAVFTPFFTTKAPGKGIGLGLPLVQRFVSEFGGAVAASNRHPRGARVTMILREGLRVDHRLRPITGEMRAISAAPGASLSSTTAPTPPLPLVVEPVAEPQRRCVLVVDDEPAIREIQRRLLNRAGIDVITAASGLAARDLLLSHSVDLVVSDLRMPGEMDGAALLAWMERERPALASTALLATGDVSGAASVALPVPPERILNKPFEGAEFVRRVRAALDLEPAVGV